MIFIEGTWIIWKNSLVLPRKNVESSDNRRRFEETWICAKFKMRQIINREKCFICGKEKRFLDVAKGTLSKTSNAPTEGYNAGGITIQHAAEAYCQDKVLCGLHVCDSEGRKEDAYAGEIVGCMSCVKGYHPECFPAGVTKEAVELTSGGKGMQIEMFECPHHHGDAIDISQSRLSRAARNASKHSIQNAAKFKFWMETQSKMISATSACRRRTSVSTPSFYFQKEERGKWDKTKTQKCKYGKAKCTEMLYGGAGAAGNQSKDVSKVKKQKVSPTTDKGDSSGSAPGPAPRPRQRTAVKPNPPKAALKSRKRGC